MPQNRQLIYSVSPILAVLQAVSETTAGPLLLCISSFSRSPDVLPAFASTPRHLLCTELELN